MLSSLRLGRHGLRTNLQRRYASGGCPNGKPTKPFNKVMVANRGEIATRVFRAINEMGKKSVAVYAKEDRMSAHIRKDRVTFYLFYVPRLTNRTSLERDLALWRPTSTTRTSSTSPEKWASTRFIPATDSSLNEATSPGLARRRELSSLAPLRTSWRGWATRWPREKRRSKLESPSSLALTILSRPLKKPWTSSRNTEVRSF
ncbi:hypothetical protein L596_014045 [Steinernema carpocapsae]|uniref:Biotin carboxylase-like N-terminal domain-containing protein n=1 Tax=Steinernema carpocapsae TaxID=34508 RepID=A0A4U5NBJ4_STECR|nr:hypothetical protein L596_014045 [Steinernema carpocapsae]